MRASKGRRPSTRSKTLAPAGAALQKHFSTLSWPDLRAASVALTAELNARLAKLEASLGAP